MPIFSRHVVHIWNYNYHIVWRDKLSIHVQITLGILFYFFNGWDDVENLKKSYTKTKIPKSYIIIENTCFGLLLGQQVTCRTVN